MHRKTVRIVMAVVGLMAVLFMVGCAATPNPGEIGVVRNGKAWYDPFDWLDNHNIKKIIIPGAGTSWTGLGSSVHWYPSDTVQRNYTITSEASRGDRPGVDIVEVPTQDGVRVGLEGTFYFTTAFNGTKQGIELVKDFDSRFGVRTFQSNNTGEALHPYEGQTGWSDFLDQAVRPVINNDLRESIATVTCAELVSSCALVHNQSVTVVANQNNNANIEKVQEAINSNLKTDIQKTLGQNYFSDIQFRLERVSLPGEIQSQIDGAQAQFAAIGTAEAKVKQAKLEAEANEAREKGYKGCPACAQIDELKAIPHSVTTFAPGAGFAVTPGK